MRKTIWFLMILLGLMVTFLVACGPDRDAGNSEISRGDNENIDDIDRTNDIQIPEKPESLIVGLLHEDHQVEVVEEILKDFEKETGIKIETRRNMETEVLSLDAPTGNGPDLFFSFHDRVGDLVSQGLVDPIQIEQKDVSNYVDYAIDALTYDEQLYAIPHVVETTALIYNKNLIDEGDLPTTLSELEKLAEEKTDPANDEYGFLFEARVPYFAYPYLVAEGGYVFKQNDTGDYDVDNIGLATDDAIKSAERLQSWFEKDYIPKNVTGGIVNGLFEEGKVATVIHLPRQVLRFQDSMGSENIGVAPLMKTDDGEGIRSFMGVKAWFVSAYSENEYWATQLALYITNTESSKKYVEIAREIPANKEAQSSDLVQKDEIFSGFVEQLQYAEPMPNVTEMTTAWGPMEDAVQYLAEGGDPGDVMREAVEQIKLEIQMQR